MRNTSATHRLALTLAAAALTVPAAIPAHANTEKNSVNVQYSDLNLSSEQGQRELTRRLEAAARQVCGLNGPLTGTRIPSRDATACYAETRANMAERFAQIVSNERRGG